jgi:hypothetical protein
MVRAKWKIHPGISSTIKATTPRIPANFAQWSIRFLMSRIIGKEAVFIKSSSDPAILGCGTTADDAAPQ